MRDDVNDPWGDPTFEMAVRETAYFMWENDGRPEGREQEYWYRALESELRKRTSDRELAGGASIEDASEAPPTLRSRGSKPSEARKRG